MRAKLPDHEGFIDRGGVKIAYEVYGSGPQTMVFLPTWTIVHSRVYKAQLPYFSERYRCITFDGRGNGKSDKPDDVAAYSLDNQVADALAIMDATDAGKAIVVGLSASGIIASILAAYYPDRVKAAILTGTAAIVGVGYPYMTPQHFRDRAKKTSKDGNKYNREHWLSDYPDFAAHFVNNIFSEPHSTKQIEDGIEWASGTTGEVLVKTVEARLIPPSVDIGEAMYRRINCPTLVIHGDDDQIQPFARAKLVAELARAELITIPGGGHNPLGRSPAKCNTAITEFLDRKLNSASLQQRFNSTSSPKRFALSVPLRLAWGHGRRDIAISQELRKLHPDLQIDWLAQDPVTRLLAASGEHIHPLSSRLASESQHIELESGRA